MKSELSSRQQASILILILIFHALLLIVMFMIEQHQAERALLHKEPIVLIEETQKIEPPIPAPIEQIEAPPIEEQQAIELPWRDWVSIESSPKAELEEPTEQPMPYAAGEDSEEFLQEQQEEMSEDIAPISAEAIADALSVAQHVLDPQDTTTVTDIDTKIPFTETETDREEFYTITPKANVVPQPAKSKMTFAQLAQGFAKQVEQAAAIEVDSNKKGVASIEQLKHLHFTRKVIDCIENSFIINRVNIPANNTIKSIAYIQLALNPDGSIHTLNIMQSSGNHEVDRFLIHVFKDASSSFPPIPASFKEKPYQFPLFVFDPQVRNERKLVIRYH